MCLTTYRHRRCHVCWAALGTRFVGQDLCHAARTSATGCFGSCGKVSSISSLEPGEVMCSDCKVPKEEEELGCESPGDTEGGPDTKNSEAPPEDAVLITKKVEITRE
ncbi:hypothetical protein NKR23_g4244 [Pleurostoma richardsiae]|uniref:Uncharacterized protein n=1 Tax=Pleurostoma richardsiae TaxID=41990 RepID=A0AA38RRQ8_9PEZI|nr:hypothetical protein NKR23_g4244 [Pleurostoma richardsiae]